MLLKGKQQITTKTMKLPLPYCLFLNNPASHPFLGLKRGKGNRKTQEKTEKITK